ncbi:transport permease protein [Actinoplanes sp. NBRC 14428]|uniref:Transport permease protein n=1 Tax=Pseudosporangium ferrugineum TaxID=439699 RepID=A0A2T0S8K5_9ACTN|nr:ABC transporter permease [Pseudosporangium ferrugineum]PRY29643.1 oleandomycin transport system permease protein [Pseudosporangium ferrugineum]BCJ52602.1 transport permease protein [Actinoplanes sp. NBRC 14428]
MTTVAEARTPAPLRPARAAPNPRPLRLLRHSLALAKRSLIKMWRTPEALIDVSLQPALFLVIFVYIFGGAVAGSTHDYLQFLLPGILAQTIATGCIAIGVNLNTDLEKGIFDRFRSLPVPRSAPLLGAVLGDIVRYVIVTMVTVGFGYVLGFRITTDPFSALAGCLLAVLFALCLSWLPVYVAMKVRTPGAVQGLMFALIMPLSFASNVFVDTATLPGWMQGFVDVNPLTHLVGAVRGLFLGAPIGNHVWWTLAWCAGLVVVFMPLALRAYRKKAS